jgi:hypothetical protein
MAGPRDALFFFATPRFALFFATLRFALFFADFATERRAVALDAFFLPTFLPPDFPRDFLARVAMMLLLGAG